MVSPTVDVIVNLYNGSEEPVTTGAAVFQLNGSVTSPDGTTTTGQAPVNVNLGPAGLPSVPLLATDAPGAPQGLAWQVSFPSVPGSPVSFGFEAPAGPAAFTGAAGTPGVITWTPTAALTALPDGTGITLAGASLPAGLTAGETYYVVGASGSTIKLATTAGGSPIAFTSSGSGTLTVVSYYLFTLTQLASVTALTPYMPATDDLSAIATANPTAASVPMNNHKFTGMANGAASGESATFGQTPAGGNTVTVPQGGTGLTATTPYALLAGGVSPGGAMQQLAALGSAGQSLTSAGAGALPLFDYGSTDWANVKQAAYAAIINGLTDDTVSVQAALTAKGNAGGGTVYQPAGMCLVDWGSLKIPSGVTWKGAGEGATFIVAKSGTSGAAVSLANPATTVKTHVRDMTFNGNGVAGTAGPSLVNTGLSPSTPGFHRLTHVTSMNMGGDGFYYQNLIETKTTNCTAFQCLGKGYNVQNGATDSRWTGCTAGATGSDGYYASGSNCHYVACKSYYAGFNYLTSAWGTGAGFHVASVSTYFSAGISFTSCEAQDCANNGWFFDPSLGPIYSISMAACVIDSCNAAGGSGALACGISTNSLVNSSIVGNSIFNRSGGAGTMSYGIAVAGTQTGLVLGLNNVNVTNTGVYYVSGYGYLLLESYQTDLSGIPQVKLGTPVLAPAGSQALSNGSTITPNTAYGSYPVTATAAVTGLIIAAGTYAGQVLKVLNTSAFSLTFAAAATSHVADGTSDVIAADTAATFTWSGSYWYRG